MLFNSLDYFIFLPLVFLTYWVLFKNKLTSQNLFLLFASYFFYGLWDWRFLFLILGSTLVDFIAGNKIYTTEKVNIKKIWLGVSILFNLGLLGFFKYYNFFIDSWVDLMELSGYTVNNTYTLQLILPVGISFYTFQTMSYSLDIYYGRLKPTTNLIDFATFVGFFPQLVAGPIERASNLLSQITNSRIFNYEQCKQGLKLILWGLFKKIVVADSIAPIVDDIFANYGDYSASTLLMGVTLFSFQVYGDFSGYSDIAIGTAKLFGIELMSNFKFPNFSRNVAEYWQRWHISLSTWFRHYLYIPLGGSRVSKLKSVRNICIIFLVSGFWHGANWTFIVWGGIHALFYIPVFLMGRNRIYMDTVVAENSWLPSLKEVAQIVFTFTLITFSRVFFRSESITDAYLYLKQICTHFSWEAYSHPQGYRMIDYLILLSIFTVYEFSIRRDERSPFKFKSKIVRFLLYSIIILAMLLFYDDQVDRSFIYFQF
ncbi:D-alanyl-lipoteichoic acid acyltransferase DltB (MBOAT superfamily) [Aquimarina intermedia]|uniref:D-alanyl-lipoteichoic acid acyltransferase DltB (MBOAT superfamily) n=1 Tax=Aquimarina intermedia TaxID=350814 RepID=A0A5S5C6X4_9FLAO|nr:D-alanyl-lipoteichoic acid acyltransferase DltB (MBOAT superfamily) [Aquimarina intermedia]